MTIYFTAADWILVYGQGYGHLDGDEDEDEVEPPSVLPLLTGAPIPTPPARRYHLTGRARGKVLVTTP